MNIENIKKLINASELPHLQKTVINGFFERANTKAEKEVADRLLIEQVSYEKKFSKVILSTDEVKIYTVSGNAEWDIKYPFRSIFKTENGIWKRIATVAPNLDTAYLIYLEHKYLGDNSQFANFATKMLGI